MAGPFSLPPELPPPDPAARRVGELLLARIRAAIDQTGGELPFRRYMELALYQPGLGYYSAGARKFGAAGDFITAPELTPLFGACVARQCAQVMRALAGDRPVAEQVELLEVGGGSGALAASLLRELAALDCLPRRYRLLELSADLRERQHRTLAREHPGLLDRLEWIDRLPEAPWQGVVLANELLDAMPVDRFQVDRDGGFQQALVGWDGAALVESYRPVQSPALAALKADLRWPLPPGYRSEINPAVGAWVDGIAAALQRGLLLLIDYGFPRAEYYHPERGMGTLMCHYRQRSHGDPYLLPGLQDITAHVDFTAVGEAGLAAGMRVAGYTSQAAFLVNSGLLELSRGGSQPDPSAKGRARLQRDINLLTSPAEMGELFKVIALAKGLDFPLAGFAGGDRRARLGD